MANYWWVAGCVFSGIGYILFKINPGNLWPILVALGLGFVCLIMYLRLNKRRCRLNRFHSDD
jgi:hypothetical protein